MTGALGAFVLQAPVEPMSLVDTTLTRAVTRNITVPLPTSWLPGDTLVLVMGGAAFDNWSPDGDMTVQGSFKLTASSYVVCTRQLQAGDPSSYTHKFGSNSNLTAVSVLYRKAAYDTIGASATLASPTVDPAITLSASGAAVALFCTSNSGVTFTTPSGFALKQQEVTAGYTSMFVFTKFVSSGSTGTVTSTPSTSFGSGILVGIKGT